jgi:hypothetical protein
LAPLALPVDPIPTTPPRPGPIVMLFGMAALQSYERCLQLAPTLADAHYNAARGAAATLLAPCEHPPDLKARTPCPA